MMQSAWGAIRTAQSLAENQLFRAKSSADLDVSGTAGANQINSGIAKDGIDEAMHAFGDENQAIAKAKYVSADSAQSVLSEVAASRANLTSMLGSALNRIGQNDTAMALSLLGSQFESSTDPARIRSSVSSILSTWDSFGQNSLSQANQTLSGAASIVSAEQLKVQQSSQSVRRSILAHLKRSQKSLDTLTKLDDNVRRFTNMTTKVIPSHLQKTSSGISQTKWQFESELEKQIADLTAAAQLAANAEVVEATHTLGSLVNSTLQKMFGLEALSR
jgi:hypothetical protein